MSTNRFACGARVRLTLDHHREWRGRILAGSVGFVELCEPAGYYVVQFDDHGPLRIAGRYLTELSPLEQLGEAAK